MREKEILINLSSPLRTMDIYIKEDLTFIYELVFLNFPYI